MFALCILYLWVKNLEWASAFTLTSQTVRTLYLILGQIFIYMMLVAVLVIGFAHSMYVMMNDIGASDGKNSFFHSTNTLTQKNKHNRIFHTSKIIGKHLVCIHWTIEFR